MQIQSPPFEIDADVFSKIVLTPERIKQGWSARRAKRGPDPARIQINATAGSPERLARIVEALAPGIAELTDLRNACYLHLPGALVRAGLSIDDSERVCKRILSATGHNNIRGYVDPVTRAVRLMRERQPVSGMSALRRILPRIADAVSDAVSRTDLPVPTFVTLEQGEQIVRDALQIEATPDLMPVLAASPGLGKTRLALQRHVDLNSGTVLCPTHADIEARVSEAKQLGLRDFRVYKGLLKVLGPDNEPACLIYDKLQRWSEAGWPLRGTLCTQCQHRTDYDGTGQPCPAYTYPEQPGVAFAVHAQAPALARAGELHGPITCDERPALEEVISVDADLLGPRPDQSWLYEWFARRLPWIAIVRKVVRHLSKTSTPGDHGIEYYGASLHAQIPSVAAADEVAFAIRELRMANGSAPHPPRPRLSADEPTTVRYDLDDILLALADPESRCVRIQVDSHRRATIEYVRRTFDGWRDSDDKPLAITLLDAGAVRLEPLLRAALSDRKLELVAATVEDPPTVRRVHIDTRAYRKDLFPLDGRVPVKVLRAFDTVVGMLPSKSTVAVVSVISYMRMTQRLPSLLAERYPRIQFIYSYYHNQRGSNAHLDCDALVLLGDPVPNLGGAAVRARLHGLATDDYLTLVRDEEVEQAIGRARSIRSTKPLLLVHVGRHPPWNWQQFETIRDDYQRPPEKQVEVKKCLKTKKRKHKALLSQLILSRKFHE